jgi:hypothetical protein
MGIISIYIMLLNSKNMTNIKKHFTTKENECSTIQQEKTKAFQTPKVILYAFIVLLLYGNKTIKHLPSNILQVFKWVVDRSKKKIVHFKTHHCRAALQEKLNCVLADF